LAAFPKGLAAEEPAPKMVPLRLVLAGLNANFGSFASSSCAASSVALGMADTGPLVLPNKEPLFAAGFSGVFFVEATGLVAPKGLALEGLGLPKGEAPGSIFVAPPPKVTDGPGAADVPKAELEALGFFLFGDASSSSSPPLSLATDAEKAGTAAAGVTPKPSFAGTPNLLVAAIPNLGANPAGF